VLGGVAIAVSGVVLAFGLLTGQPAARMAITAVSPIPIDRRLTARRVIAFGKNRTSRDHEFRAP
jgi:hypothetical protein